MIEDSHPPCVASLEELFAEAGLQNLIANAIRYTPRGEVVIGALELGAECAVECWVSDNGAHCRSATNQEGTLTQAESEAAICNGIIRFQEYLGWRSERIHTHFIKDLPAVSILGVLTFAERQLGKSLSPEKGRDLIKQVHKQLLELARPMP